MSCVTVSEKYQIVIPKEIRENANIKPGTKLEIIQFGNRIELVPVINIANLQGMFKGINTDIEREEDA